jgi:hypothetical protein
MLLDMNLILTLIRMVTLLSNNGRGSKELENARQFQPNRVDHDQRGGGIDRVSRLMFGWRTGGSFR